MHRFFVVAITAALCTIGIETMGAPEPVDDVPTARELAPMRSPGGSVRGSRRPGPSRGATGRRTSARPTAATPTAGLSTWLTRTKSGALLLRTANDPALTPGPVLETDVHLTVSGVLAHARLTQRFRNPSDDWAEGIYVFPLPEDAAVDHLRIDTGARVIEGVVKEKAEARRAYERARSDGRRASLVEQERPNVFTASVANIPPRGEIAVEIEYQQSVQVDQGEFSLRFPMVVAPRFVPGQPRSETGFTGGGWAPDTDRVPDGSRITPPVRRSGAGPIHPVLLEVDLAPGFAIDAPTSPYHDIDVQEVGAHYRVRLADGPVPADRDFVLSWTPAPGDEPQIALFSEALGDRDFAVLMVTPPRRPGREPAPPPREVVFVIDTSGSMAGESLIQAQAALGLALGRLRPADRFNVIEFDSQTRALFPQSVDATYLNVQQALAAVKSLVADGGTHILPALQMALASGARSGRLRQVVFLTDGSVGNETELFEEIRASLGESRLFAIGIGSAPNSHFMRKAAQHGRGSFTHIGKPEEVAEKMGALFRKLEAVVLTDVTLELPTGHSGERHPEDITDLYLGEPAVFTVALDQPLEGLRVRGLRGAERWEVELDADDAVARRGVHALWARRKIDALMDERLGVRDETVLHALRDDVVAVALEHHLVGRYTSLVAVDVTPARGAYEPYGTHAMAVNLPAGWQHDAVFGMAQGATPAGWQLAIGLVLLTTGWALRSRLLRTPC